MRNESPKVLLIRLSSLGDLVLATAAFAPFRQAGWSISLVTKSEFAAVFEGHPDLAAVYPFEKSIGEDAAREKLLAWAESQGFALVVDLQNSWRTWRWRRRLRGLAPVAVMRKTRWREWLVLVFRMGSLFGFGRGGRALRFRRMAEKVLARQGLYSVASGPLTSLAITEAERAAVRSCLPQKEFVVLLPGGAWRSKEWPYFADLARLLARKAPVVVLGGAKDVICEEVARAAQEINAESCSLHGRTSLRESMAVIAESRWVIGNDTGMVHVGEALGKLVAMIEGPTHPFMGFSPYRERSLVIGLPLLCRPCSKSGRICWRLGTRHCLNGLKVASVAEILREKGFPC